MKRKKIIINYITSKFIFDIIATIPYEWLLRIKEDEEFDFYVY